MVKECGHKFGRGTYIIFFKKIRKSISQALNLFDMVFGLLQRRQFLLTWTLTKNSRKTDICIAKQ